MEYFLIVGGFIILLSTHCAVFLQGIKAGKTKAGKGDTMLNAYKARTAAMLKIAGK